MKRLALTAGERQRAGASVQALGYKNLDLCCGGKGVLRVEQGGLPGFQIIGVDAAGVIRARPFVAELLAQIEYSRAECGLFIAGRFGENVRHHVIPIISGKAPPQAGMTLPTPEAASVPVAVFFIIKG